MMQAYAEYKDSGASLVELVLPTHWHPKKCRFVFKFNKGLTITKENLQETGIPCVNYGEIHSKFSFEVDPSKHDLKCVDPAYLKNGMASLLQKGDFVFADTSEDIEGSGNFTCLISSERTFAGYHTLIARTNGDGSNRFLAYVLDSSSFRAQVRKSVKGVKVYSITQAILKDMTVWFPPLSEQTLIAKFLDDKTAKIETLLGIKRRQIELLAERKQTLIQNAVTKGLNPNTLMKDSGVDWIGPIPAHWEMKRVKNIFQLIIDPAGKNNSYELLSIYTDIGVRPRKDLKEKGNKASTTDGYWIVKKGDFIVNKLLAWMGAVGISEFEGVTSPAYDILRACRPISGYFYHYLFRTKVFSTVMKVHSKGIMDMRLRLYFDKFGAIEVPYPNRTEQQEISEFIDRESNKIDGAMTIKQNQIIKLNEYKTTLINAAVTGKIKVA